MKKNNPHKNLLLIFTRNPEFGKVKTRLAKDLGDENALKIYKLLLQHTVQTTQNIQADKQVHYSVRVRNADYWDENIFSKKQQEGTDLGERMNFAFKKGFEEGYKNIIIIGSDLYDLLPKDIEKAFQELEKHDYVIGPAEDGGYYLLGMNSLNSNLFKNKKWGTSSVLEDTLANLNGSSVKLLKTRNDIDILDDIKNIPEFQKFIKFIK